MTIADWSDEKLLAQEQQHPDGYAAEIVRLRGELRACRSVSRVVHARLVESTEGRDALAARFEVQCAATRGAQAMVADLQTTLEAEHSRLEDAQAQVSALRSALEGLRLSPGLDAGTCHYGITTRAGCSNCKRLDAAHAALAHTAAAAAEWERALLVKERGMVACLRNALEELVKYQLRYAVSSPEQMPHQWQLANKVLADGAAMAKAHDAEVRAKALLDGARLLEKADAGLYAWASSGLRTLAKGETKP